MRYDKNATNRRQIMPDPEAPSVKEIVEVLREARKHIPYITAPEMHDERTRKAGESAQRIDNLIARLEGA